MLLDVCLHSEEKGMHKLQELFEDLPHILTADDQDCERMAVQTKLIDETLLLAYQEVKNVAENGANHKKNKLLIIGSTPTWDVIQQCPKSLLTRLPNPWRRELIHHPVLRWEWS